MESVKEIRTKILEKLVEDGIPEEEAKTQIKDKYNELAELNSIFKLNPLAGYNIVASEFGVKLQSDMVSKEASVLVGIGETSTYEKVRFDWEGYLVRDLRTFENSKGNDMMYVEIADKTGIGTITVFHNKLEEWFDEVDLNAGDFVRIHSIIWEDKNDGYAPKYDKKSSLEKVAEPSFEFKDVKLNSISEMTPTTSKKDRHFYTIKGVVTKIPSDEYNKPFHCATGHWFKGIGEEKIGAMHRCDKCEKPMEVFNFIAANQVQFIDEGGIAYANFSTFNELDELNVMDELVLSGEFNAEKEFNVFNVIRLAQAKKN